jgi:AraC-like DNA-binding protein
MEIQMNVKYNASFYDAKGDRIRFSGSSKEVFDKCANEKNWNNEVYFYPSEREEPVWLWVVGREQAWEYKRFDKIIFMNRLVIHFCTKGKGYYNGQPIGKGSCFIIWPYLAATLQSDPDDPMEFYWIILRGEQLEDFAKNHGLSPSKLVFNTDSVDSMVSVLNIAIDMDYSKVNIYEYTMGLLNMILSYHKPAASEDDEPYGIEKYSHNYVKTAKNIMDRRDYSISISELANMLGLTPKHFGRVFRRSTGKTPKQYMIDKRMKIAADLLEKGVPPNEAAIILKYSDYASFYRAFVQKYGVSPKCYSK